MYGLPRDLDLSFFLEKTLLQVCVIVAGRGEVKIHHKDTKDTKRIGTARYAPSPSPSPASR
jgi:hypothetical protein